MVCCLSIDNQNVWYGAHTDQLELMLMGWRAGAESLEVFCCVKCLSFNFWGRAEVAERHSGRLGQQEFQYLSTSYGKTQEHELDIILGLHHARIHAYILAGLCQCGKATYTRILGPSIFTIFVPFSIHNCTGSS